MYTRRLQVSERGSLNGLLAAGTTSGGYGVYTGEAALKDGPLRVLPVATFLRELSSGRVLG